MRELKLKGNGYTATVTLENITNIYLDDDEIVIEYRHGGWLIGLPTECFDFETVRNSIIQAINEIVESI